MKDKNAGKKRGNLGPKQISLILILILEIMLVFAVLDYFAHALINLSQVPTYYFGDEAIYGTILGFFVYLIIRKNRILPTSIVFSAVMALAIQAAYIILGYSLNFVIAFFVIDFALLLLVSYFGFKIKKM